MAEVSPELFQKVQQATGLVKLQGPVYWSQQQLLEKLPDPLVQKIVKILQGLETSKREWEKVLQILSEDKVQP